MARRLTRHNLDIVLCYTPIVILRIYSMSKVHLEEGLLILKYILQMIIIIKLRAGYYFTGEATPQSPGIGGLIPTLPPISYARNSNI